MYLYLYLVLKQWRKSMACSWWIAERVKTQDSKLEKALPLLEHISHYSK